ncbi:hypothetical protein FJZ27_01875 [Candidatus Peribacteria bacterium]|nr:hypothetical protein [Candidatus Peribacteria bacterium]
MFPSHRFRDAFPTEGRYYRSIDHAVDDLTDAPICDEAIDRVRDALLQRYRVLMDGHLRGLLRSAQWTGIAHKGRPVHDVVATDYDKQYEVLLERYERTKQADACSFPNNRQWVTSSLDGDVMYEIHRPHDPLLWRVIRKNETSVMANPAPGERLEMSAITDHALLVTLRARRKLWGVSTRGATIPTTPLPDSRMDDLLHDVGRRCQGVV